MTYNKITTFFLSLFILLNFSCSKKEEGAPLEAVGDAYYYNKKDNDTKVSALVFYVYANKALKNAHVTLTNGNFQELDNSKNNRFILFTQPESNDFKPTYPPSGDYIFDMESKDGDVLKSTDRLSKKNLPIPEITEIRFEENDASYDLSWEAIDIADRFEITLLDKNKNQIFESNIIEKGTTTYTLIPGDLGTWQGNIEIGQNYTIQLRAIVFDNEADLSAPEGDATSPLFNIAEISLGEQSFIWNEQ